MVVIVLVLFTLSGMAQDRRRNQSDRKGGPEMMKDMTPSEIADLKSKKLSLNLDLTDSQQKKVYALILTQAETNQNLRKERQEGNMEEKGKPSKDEFINRENHRLDQQIKMKREMKAILTPEQYSKFEKMKPRPQKRHRKTREKR